MSTWKFWKKSPKPKDFVAEFLEKNSEKIPAIRTLDQLEFVVLDTETTGFDVEKDHVLSFGALKIKNRKIRVSESLELYPFSDRSVSSTVAIHGILEKENRVTLEDFSEKLLEFIGNGILVGHHVGYDLEMLLRILKPFGLNRFPNPVLDTMTFAMRLDHGPFADLSQIQKESYSLDSVCERFGIEPDDRHTAGGDAFLTAQLLQKLLVLGEKKGIRTFKELI
ncbi:3'-5' exonuclease [Algoriphagus mannitolivorans]|uniref:3'-5' exonuclease n=1 Tax=Algoriphagus mannitolivorans TaxID=226504 RepID=UPI0003F7EA32|nr:3'-5' exonuclease [Algoriphagus mannitolivorans]